MKVSHYRSRRMAFESLEQRELLAFDPTALEQEMLQLTNRFRSDPTNEYARLIAAAAPIRSPNSEVTTQLVLSGVDAALLRSELSQLSPSPPVAWNEVIHNLATTQNNTMIARNSQEHFPGLANALFAMGVPIEAGTGQNAFYNNLGIGQTPFFVHSAYVIDWANGAPGATGGMQAGRGHRVNMLNPTYNQIGSAVTVTNSLVNTQFFAKVSSAQKLAVGAVFEDKNRSGWYEAGEGIGGVQIVFQGGAGRFTTTALSAGGYQIILPAGTFSVTATGGSLQHAITLPSVTMGAANVWQNLIYDPAAVPPDSMEPNNSSATANDLGSRDQTINGLSIHPGDVDFFKVTSSGEGAAAFELRFTHSQGNLDLRLLDGNGSEIASSVTSNSIESLNVNLQRDQTYFVQVFSSTAASNGLYALQVNLPEPAAPTAVLDRGLTAQGTGEFRLALLDNDIDPDGTRASLTPTVLTQGAGTFTINSAKSLSFAPAAGYSGVDRATYSVIDDQGLRSNSAGIEVLVVNFAAPKPWQNARRPLDVNDDGILSPLDALLIINEIVARGSRVMPTTLADSAGILGFLDTSGSNSLEPRDVLLVINELNRIRGGNGEGESLSPHDAAMQQLMSEDYATDLRRKRR